MRVGEEVESVVVKLIHNRSIFGKIDGESGKTWEQYHSTSAPPR